jgi:hypothetical protein
MVEPQNRFPERIPEHPQNSMNKKQLNAALKILKSHALAPVNGRITMPPKVWRLIKHLSK